MTDIRVGLLVALVLLVGCSEQKRGEVEINVKYEPLECSFSHPLRVQVTNNTRDEVSKARFHVGIRIPGHSTDVSNILSEYTEDTILKAGQSTATCWAIPFQKVTVLKTEECVGPSTEFVCKKQCDITKLSSLDVLMCQQSAPASCWQTTPKTCSLLPFEKWEPTNAAAEYNQRHEKGWLPVSTTIFTDYSGRTFEIASSREKARIVFQEQGGRGPAQLEYFVEKR